MAKCPLQTDVCGREEQANVDVAHDRAPARFISRDITKGERAEAELDAFITKREKERVASEGERRTEAAYRMYERRAQARREAERSQGWATYFRRLQITYAGRSEECGRRAEEIEGTL